MLTAWLVVAALAAPRDRPTLLYEGDPTEAVERASRDAGLRPERLEPVLWETVLGDRALWVEGASFRSEGCEPVDMARLGRDLKEAEGWFYSMVLDRSRQDLERFMDSLCGLTEPLDPTLAARAAYLTGVVAALEEREAAAVSAFQRARDFEPELSWDPALSPEPVPSFLQQRPPTPPASLTLDSHIDPRHVRIDGQSLPPVSEHHVLTEGVHLLQIVAPEVRTLLVTVGSGATVTLLDPLALPPDLGAHPEAERGRAITARAIARSGQAWGDPLLWTGAAGTWALDPTMMSWDQRRPRPRWTVVGAGAGVALAGAGLGAWSWLAGQSTAESYRPGVDTLATWNDLDDRLTRLRWAWRGAWALAGVGLATSGTALMLPRLQVRLAPGPTPLGVGATVTRRH